MSQNRVTHKSEHSSILHLSALSSFRGTALWGQPHDQEKMPSLLLQTELKANSFWFYLGGRKICSVLSLSSQNNTEVFKAPNLFSFLQSRRAWGCTYTCITYTQLLLFLLKQILAPTALLFFPYIGGDKKIN